MGGTMVLSSPRSTHRPTQLCKKASTKNDEGTTERTPKLTRILGELGGRDDHVSDVCMRIIRGNRLQKCPNEMEMQEVPSNLWLKQAKK